MMSTATKLSKFGLPLMEETRQRLIQIYSDNPWLNSIHIHVGSQGVPMERFVSGTRVLMAFIKDIEASCGDQIKVVDIGGGLSTSYTEPQEPAEFTFQKYRDFLNKEVQKDFLYFSSSKFQLIRFQNYSVANIRS